MASKWQKAALVQPPQILGRQLLPFSHGHFFVLGAMESPYVKGGSVTNDDLVSAVFICSHTFEENQALLFSDHKYEKQVGAWARKLKKFSFYEAREQFVDYYDVFTNVPDHWISQDNKRPKAAYEFTVVTGLVSSGVCTLSEAWNMGFSLARCYYSAVAESNGDDSLLSEDEKKFLGAED